MREVSLFALMLPLMTGLFGALLAFVLAPASLLIWSLLPLVMGLVATGVLSITLRHIVHTTRLDVLEELQAGQVAACPPMAVPLHPQEALLPISSPPRNVLLVTPMNRFPLDTGADGAPSLTRRMECLTTRQAPAQVVIEGFAPDRRGVPG